MKQKTFVLLFCFGTIFITTKSYSIGLGVHLTGGASIYRGYNEDEYGDRMFIGAGVTLDTAVVIPPLKIVPRDSLVLTDK
jgi:hypothetical protein